MDDDFILLQIYDETQDEVRDKDLEVRKIEAKVQKLFKQYLILTNYLLVNIYQQKILEFY